ncbi:hypothetical protein [Roseixanthobacter liquoris]|uniref:hypothetical protein n=1 Tax=Roseixanthobacter liquoris TaxID=3119921 RepID=UPI003729DD8E
MKVGGGLLAACALCCAATILPAILAGTGLVAMGGAAWAWGGGAAVLAIAAASGAIYIAQRKHSPTPARTNARNLIAAARSQTCGCGPTGQTDAAIACTLGANDFKTRAGEIRDLARRSLRHAVRKPLSLTLTYGIEAADEVRKLVAKESECCPFLTFGVRETADAIEVAILAPAAAAEAADALFDHFAPELAASKNKEIA